MRTMNTSAPVSARGFLEDSSRDVIATSCLLSRTGCGALSASTCLVGGAPKRSGHGRLDVLESRSSSPVGRDEDECCYALKVESDRAEGLTEQPARPVPADRLADLPPRQERHSRRPHSCPKPQGEVLGSDRLSGAQDVPKQIAVSDDAVPPEPLTGQGNTYRVVSRFLPFARRRASTFLPPGVELRLRNPCFLFPLRFFG